MSEAGDTIYAQTEVVSRRESIRTIGCRTAPW